MILSISHIVETLALWLKGAPKHLFRFAEFWYPSDTEMVTEKSSHKHAADSHPVSWKIKSGSSLGLTLRLQGRAGSVLNGMKLQNAIKNPTNFCFKVFVKDVSLPLGINNGLH